MASLLAGASIEGSVIVERQDANAKAYGSSLPTSVQSISNAYNSGLAGYSVTAKQLLSGQVDVPGFADILVDTIARRSGGAENWVAGEDDDEIRPSPSAGYSFGSQFASGGSSSAGAEKKSSRFAMGRSRSSSTAVKGEGDLFGFGTGGPSTGGGEARFEQQFSDEFRLRDDEDFRAGSGATTKSGSGKRASAKLTKSWGGAGDGGGRDREQWSAEASPSTARDSFDSLDRDDDRDRSGYGRFGDNDADYPTPQKTGRFRSSTTTSGSRPSLFARARSASSPFTSRNSKSSRPTTPGATASPFHDAYSSPPSRNQPLSTAKPWDSEDEDFLDPPPSRPPVATSSPSRGISTPRGDPFDLSEVDASFQDTLAEIAGEREPRRHAPPPPKMRSRSSTGGGGIGRAIALYDFNGVEVRLLPFSLLQPAHHRTHFPLFNSQSTDLPFKKGDIITILARDDEEWWKGRLKITEGMFPRNYVEAHFDE